MAARQFCYFCLSLILIILVKHQLLTQGSPQKSSAGNSDNMTGSVTVSIFFVESNGALDSNLYNWNIADEDQIISQIIQGLNYWVNQAPKYNVNVSFSNTIYRSTDLRCQVRYEPIRHNSFEKGLWINEIMANFGYTSGSTFSRVNNYNTDARLAGGTDRAFSIFVCYNPNPADILFMDGFGTTSVLGGPYIHMLFRNDLISSDVNISIIAHKTGNIFGALDECNNCIKSETSKNIPNMNCENNIDGSVNKQSVDCIMKTKSFSSSVCTYTASHIGWINAPYIHTITTIPPGLEISTTKTGPTGTAQNATPAYFFWSPGEIINISTVSPQNIGTVNYIFKSWSDSGNISHNINIKSLSDTLIANFIGPPGKTFLAHPLNDEHNIPINAILQWNAVTNAEKYQIQISTDAAFLIPVRDIDNVIATQYQVSALLYGKTYYWKVRAKNQAGSGAWSDIKNFTTKISPPALIEPVNYTNNISTNPLLKWNAVPEVSFYQLQMSTDQQFVNIILNQSNINDTIYNSTGLIKNLTYYWRVKAYSFKGISDWSAISCFTTAATTAQIFINTFNLNFQKAGYLSGKIDSIIRITNGSNLDSMIITQIYFENETPVFNAGNTAPITIPPNGNFQLTITFNPDSVGFFSERLHIVNSSNNNSDAIIEISGSIIGSEILITPSSIDFGSIGFGADPIDTGIVFKNIGMYPVKILSCLLKQPDSSFTVFSDIPFKGMIMNPGSDLIIHLKIIPNKTGIISNSIILLNNSSNFPYFNLDCSTKILRSDLELLANSIIFDTSNLLKPNRTGILIIKNNSSTLFELFNISISGDTSSFHLLNNILKKQISPFSTDSLFIKFYPHTFGPKNASLTFNTTDPLIRKKTIFLSGFAGGVSLIHLQENILNLGKISINTVKDSFLTIRNIGNLDLELSDLEISGKDKNNFIITGRREDIKIENNGNELINIRGRGYLPVGEKNAELLINSNDRANPLIKIKLLAEVTSPVIYKLIDKIDFGEIEINKIKDSAFIIRNEGNAPLIIKNIFIDGPNFQYYSMDTISLPLILSPGEARSFKTTFSPKEEIEYLARIALKSNDPANSEISVILYGKGRKYEYKSISVSDTAINFGKTLINDTAIKEITFSNLNDIPITIDSIYFRNISNGFFAIKSANFPYIINSNENCKINLVFNPYERKTYTDTLFILVNNGSENIKKVILSGQGVFPCFIVPKEIDFGFLYPDSVKKIIIKLINSGDGELRISKIFLQNNNDKEFSLQLPDIPLDIPSESTDSLTALFSAKTPGEKSAKILFQSNYNDSTIIFLKAKCNNNTGIAVIKNDNFLLQNYPNPFNPSTNINYSLSKPGNVNMKIFNSLGEEVETLLNEAKQRGNYSLRWQPFGIPSGVYIIRLKTSERIEALKVLYLK